MRYKTLDELMKYNQMRIYKTIARGVQNNANEHVDVCVNPFFTKQKTIEIRMNNNAIAFVNFILKDSQSQNNKTKIIDIFIEELWVRKDKQRQGNATILFKYLFQVLKETQDKVGCKHPIQYRLIVGELITRDKINGN